MWPRLGPNLDMLATPAAIRQRSPATSNQMVWRGGNSRRIPRHRNSGGPEVTLPGEIAVCCSRTGRQSRRSLLIVSTEAEAPQPARTVPPAIVALIAPDSGMERQAKVGKAGMAFLIAF